MTQTRKGSLARKGPTGRGAAPPPDPGPGPAQNTTVLPPREPRNIFRAAMEAVAMHVASHLLIMAQDLPTNVSQDELQIEIQKARLQFTSSMIRDSFTKAPGTSERAAFWEELLSFCDEDKPTVPAAVAGRILPPLKNSLMQNYERLKRAPNIGYLESFFDAIQHPERSQTTTLMGWRSACNSIEVRDLGVQMEWVLFDLVVVKLLMTLEQYGNQQQKEQLHQLSGVL